MATLNPTRGAAVVLNYNNPNDLKYFYKATKGLDDGNKYDLSPDKLKSFLDQVEKRVRLSGWAPVLTVPTIAVAPAVGVNRNLIAEYGNVTIAECQVHAATYMAGVTVAGQMSVMLYHFLFDSLTIEGLNKVNVDTAPFMINNERDGLCFLRTIITKAQLDTVVTVHTLRNSLGKLEVKIVECAGDIEKFHMHVNTLTNALDSYGQPYPELIVNLFKAYELIEDAKFNHYVQYVQYGYSADPDAYNARTLINSVENNYRTRVEAGTWPKTFADKEGIPSIAALQAEIQAMKATQGGSNNSDAKAKAKEEKYAWKKIPPKEGESKSKPYEDRTYHWCGKHKLWTIHTEAECTGVKVRGARTANTPAPQALTTAVEEKVTSPPAERVAEAMKSIVRFALEDNY
jgi:hypothetical protein